MHAFSSAPVTQTVISDHFAEVSRALSQLAANSVDQLAGLFRSARDRRAFIYIAGNGGSASTASHWVNDLGKATKRSGQLPLKVMSLTDNVPWFSALSNDEGYERSLAGQLENFASPGDLLVCISASGNSANLIRAVELAQKRQVITVALLGFDGGALNTMVDFPICVATQKGAYELVEDIHSIICHAVVKSLVADRLESAA
jgi:D-sedoheptulose 7-phosphate isomerase